MPREGGHVAPNFTAVVKLLTSHVAHFYTQFKLVITIEVKNLSAILVSLLPLCIVAAFRCANLERVGFKSTGFPNDHGVLLNNSAARNTQF